MRHGTASTQPDEAPVLWPFFKDSEADSTCGAHTISTTPTSASAVLTVRLPGGPALCDRAVLALWTETSLN
ncbi:unnamed protein product [Arctogadus glacialis]